MKRFVWRVLPASLLVAFAANAQESSPAKVAAAEKEGKVVW
jgi:hypothetical protein